jgi:dethiobiotin synthetase
MVKGIFITGTDTGVGKTFVAAGLIRAFNKMHMSVAPMKPVETGCKTKKGKTLPADTVLLIKASGLPLHIEEINPYRLKHPLAPAVAAELERVRINTKKILSAFNALSKRHDLIIAEGAGGIMVPVYKDYIVLDLVKDLKLPLIIVSKPGLGTINHTLLTIEVAKRKGVRTLGVIINYSINKKRGLPEKTNPGIIERLSGVPVLGIVPHVKKQSPFNDTFSYIAEKILSLLKTKNGKH